jgi:hypothetical protein
MVGFFSCFLQQQHDLGVRSEAVDRNRSPPCLCDSISWVAGLRAPLKDFLRSRLAIRRYAAVTQSFGYRSDALCVLCVLCVSPFQLRLCV